MTDATAMPLLYQCRRRAYLLRRALEAIETPLPGGSWACRAMDAVDREIDSIERAIKQREAQKNGRDSD